MTEYISCICGCLVFRILKTKDGKHVLSCYDCANDHSSIKILDMKPSSIIYWSDKNEADKNL